MSKHFSALFIFFVCITASGCDKFCQDNPELEFCLVLAEIEDRRNENHQAEVQCEVDCAGTYGAVCVDDGDGDREGICECPEGLLEEPLGRCVSPEACREAISLIISEETQECLRCEEGTVPNTDSTACVCPEDHERDPETEACTEVSEGGIYLSLTPQANTRLVQGRMQLIGFELISQDEVELTSVFLEIRTTQVDIDRSVSLWFEQDDGVFVETEEQGPLTYTTHFQLETVLQSNVSHSVEVYGHITQSNIGSVLDTCVSAIEYRSVRTGIEYATELEREYCQTLRN